MSVEEGSESRCFVVVLRRLTQCELILKKAKAESGRLEGENIALQQVLSVM